VSIKSTNILYEALQTLLFQSLGPVWPVVFKLHLTTYIHTYTLGFSLCCAEQKKQLSFWPRSNISFCQLSHILLPFQLILLYFSCIMFKKRFSFFYIYIRLFSYTYILIIDICEMHLLRLYKKNQGKSFTHIFSNFFFHWKHAYGLILKSIQSNKTLK